MMLAALRSALYILFLIVTLVPWALVAVAFSALVRGRPLYRVCAGWLRVAILGARWICGVRWQVQGLQHLPSAQDHKAAVVLCAKHQSTWETFAFPALMPHPLAYVFKRELLWIPFFGWAMARMDMIHIDRSRRSEAWAKVLSRGRELMADGNWVIMFPEGTRTARGAQGDYKTGATRLATVTGVPVVPIAVNSARCWPRKSWLLRPGLITVSVGAPIASQGRRHDELMREVEAWIETEMRRIDPQAYSGPYQAPARPETAGAAAAAAKAGAADPARSAAA